MALPEGLKFLQIGWWVSHALFVWLIYAHAYRKGRADQRKAAGTSVEPPAPR